ncbi:MAG: leucyl/phenylalanyl-tRNA--protein transferase [Halopseudomonas yangmingensis]|uniref:Leucyl/phenylalanyl-tRNA--protein transferase n=1 Tax=Halopseudomonas yangmingensis TaxID=1720063 RepID=A0A1I4RPB9_9GAMM|nr:leucyl/phenylalanyl-tRNA--protein transferase [Halopseudomonas yangmingensis]SFM54016.1 leucyl/phenylalanyl-tRNA--protein transferase [Halopseudomonas yangmingensis]
MSALSWLQRDRLWFPPAQHALQAPNGLLAGGGDLSPERLLLAYRSGIFPWYSKGQPLLWWSPDPRTVLQPNTMHVSRSLRRFLRSNRLQVSHDRDFAGVIAACAAPRDYTDSTWITDEMQAAYIELHRRGHAHSIEVWQQDTLVGGLYGVVIGRLFCGESMFSRVDNASKTALFALCHYLQQRRFMLIDCQMPTAHLDSLGACNISRNGYLAQLAECCPPGQPSAWPESSPGERVDTAWLLEHTRHD